MPSILDLMLQPRGLNVRGPNFNPNIPPQPVSIQNGPMNPMQIADMIQNSPQDFGNMPPMDEAMLSGFDVSPQGSADIPISRVAPAIQEALGAKEPETNNLVKQILANRKPRVDDIGTAAVQTLMGGKPVSSQQVADERFADSLAPISLLAKMQGGGSGGGSVFAMTMEAINSDPNLASLPMMDKIRLAQNKLGTNLSIDPSTGQVVDMSGAAGSLGNLKYGETMGKQRAEIETVGDIETNKQNAALRVEQQGMADKKATAAVGALDLLDQAEIYLDQATGSYPGAAVAAGKSFFGKSDESTQANAALEIIGQNLVAMQPRMEGPQSNFDVQMYQKMAGKVADPSVPAGDKRAAISEMRRLNLKYADRQSNPDAGTYQPPQQQMDPSLFEFMTPEERALFGQ
jgi:hypothetical protein